MVKCIQMYFESLKMIFDQEKNNNELENEEQITTSPKDIIKDLHSVGERMPGESDLAVVACNVWLSLNQGRNYYILTMEMQRLYKDGRIDHLPSPKELRLWRQKYDWESRAAKYDSNLELYNEYHAYNTLVRPLAQNWGRIQKLIYLAERLESLIEDNLILTEVKRLKSGNTVTTSKMNTPLLIQYRAVLDDIAKETGGRSGRAGVTDPLEFLRSRNNTMRVEELDDSQLAQLGSLLEIMRKNVTSNND